jgi:hypothetical protein
VNNPEQGGQAAGRPRGDCPLTPQWPNHAPGVLVGCTCPGGYNPPDHDCPKQEFLDDPITRAYGVGAEMVALVSCPVCDAEEATR